MARTRLVVDADVMRSASERPASRAKACKAALECVRTSKHFDLALSAELRAEWDVHRSTWSRKWLNAMVGAGRVVKVKLEPYAPLRAAYAAESDDVVDVIDKDAHLVDLAMATDRRVLSNDERTRRHLVRRLDALPGLERLHWASPEEDGCVEWLARCTPSDGPFRLTPL